MDIPRQPIVIIKITSGYGDYTKKGDLGTSSLGRDTMERSETWRVARDLEIDLYHQGIENILESIKKFDP